MSLNLVVLLTIVSAGDVVRYLVAGLAALAAHIDQSEISIETIWPIRAEYYLNTESSLLSIRLNLLAAMSDTLLWVCRLSSWTNQRSVLCHVTSQRSVLWPSDQSEASITWSRHQSSSSSVSTASRTLVPSSEVNKLHFRYLHAEYCQMFDISPLLDIEIIGSSGII